jgi:pSer/pThr/pTyr-binding forkhead associated (FHA) protein
MAPAQVAQARAEAGLVPGRLVVTRSQVVPVGAVFEAGPVPTTVGRSDDNVVVLDGDDYASGRHARVESGLDGTWVIDLGSTNGTYVNGERIQGRTRLHEGDLLQVGDTELRFER